MTKKILIFGLLMLVLISCTESKKSVRKYYYETGESSVELKILNGKDYLVFDTPTKANIHWKKIDLNTASIYGTGIKILGVENDIIKTEIKIPSSKLDLDTLEISLHYELNGDNIKTEFKVPVKNEK